ncbi:MAG: RodZ domain-containing protein [Pseudomonadota bacterium]
MTDSNNQQPGKVTTGSPGALLRQAREASGQTQIAVGEVLHLTVHYIKSLENDDYNKLPGLTFVKGYVRAYARHLKLDVDTVLRSYDEFVSTLPEQKTQTTSTNYSYSRKRNDQAIGWAIAATFVVVAGLGAGWWFVGRDAVNAASRSTPAVAAAQTANQSAAAANNVTSQSVAPANTFGSTSPYVPATQTTAAVGLATTSTTAVVDTTALVPADATQPGLARTAPATLDATLAATPGMTATTEIAGDAVNAATVPADTATTGLAPDTALAQPVDAASTTATLPVDAAQSANDNLTVMPAANGGRQLTLISQGSDELLLVAAGNSWVEIDDGRNVRIFAEMLRAGDTLVLQGMAPFQVLLGDGRGVQVSFNSTAIDITNSIRTDSTARLNLANPNTATTPIGTQTGTPAGAPQ